MSGEQDWDRFFMLVAEFEDDLNENAVAMENLSAVRRLKFRLMEISSYDRYIAEKAGEISEHLGILFSARRHKKYPGGADEVYAKITNDLLGRIRQRATLIRRALAEGDEVPK